MGEIRVNDIVYGTSFASGVTCDDDKTVQEKLSNAAYIDIENEEISEIPRGDYLYTTDIIDNLESESDTHVLSAKQGKILNEKIENGLHDVVDNLESTDSTKALSANQGRVLNEKIDNFDLSDFGLDMELTQVEYDNLRNLNQIDPQVTYFITDGDNQTDFQLNKNLADFFSISKDYTIGDYCISNGQLYEFIEDKLAGDWNEDKVKEITIKDKIETLKQDLESCFQFVSDGKNLVASAITDQGINTASDATFEEFSRNILAIPNAELYRANIIDAMKYTNQGLTSESSWDDIYNTLNTLFPQQLNLLSYLSGKWTMSNVGLSSYNPLSFDASSKGTATATSASFDITTYKSLSVTASHSAYEGQGGGADCTYNSYLHLDNANKNISLNKTTTIDLSSYTGTAYIYATCMRAKQYRPDGTDYTGSSKIYFSKLMLIAS